MIRTVAAALAFALHIFAADVTGSWQTTWKDRDGRTGATIFKFAADGNKLTGSITTSLSEQWAIIDGVIDGDQISFAVALASERDDGRAMYTGKVEETRIVFVVRSERDKEGHKFTAHRMKEAGAPSLR